MSQLLDNAEAAASEPLEPRAPRRRALPAAQADRLRVLVGEGRIVRVGKTGVTVFRFEGIY
jgi:hypothetical protein